MASEGLFTDAAATISVIDPTGDWRGDIMGATLTGTTPYTYTFDLLDPNASISYQVGDPIYVKSLEMVTTEDGNTCPWSEI
jgi:hypothetical protein